MGRTKKITGYYVKVEPDNWLHPTDTKQSLQLCHEIVASIKRHIDGIESITVETNSEFICEYCGNYWTEKPTDKHNGGCCERDAQIMLALEKGQNDDT